MSDWPWPWPWPFQGSWGDDDKVAGEGHSEWGAHTTSPRLKTAAGSTTWRKRRNSRPYGKRWKYAWSQAQPMGAQSAIRCAPIGLFNPLMSKLSSGSKILLSITWKLRVILENIWRIVVSYIFITVSSDIYNCQASKSSKNDILMIFLII